MKQQLFPVYCAHMLSQSERELIFRTPSGKLCKFKSDLKLILELLRKSNGTTSAETIAHLVSKDLHMSASDVHDAIEGLVTYEILMDSRTQFLKLHTLTCNPPRYPAFLSISEIETLTQIQPDYLTKEPATIYEDTDAISPPVFEALRKRHSCRNFQNIPVEINKLFAICKASYSFDIRPTASAGALFPLSVYFINRISSGHLPAGLYQYDPKNNRLLLLKFSFFPEQLQYALNDTECVFNAPCIFFICADLSRHMKKYTNAGYRYTILEAGQAVQNMTIAASELDLGGVEYGGFCDDSIRQLFQMPEHEFPLACYALGYEDTEKKQDQIFLKKNQEKLIIDEEMKKKGLHVKLFLSNDTQFQLSNRRVVVSGFTDAHGQTEFGTGIDPVYYSACLKSTMETYERYILTCRYFDFIERADRMNRDFYLNPAEYIPYSDTQITQNGFTKFCSEIPIEWLHGFDLNGSHVYVPADMCFNTANGNQKMIHIANTSGCAAHFDIDAAKQAALLELIERDALMKSWFYKQSPYKIREHDLPDDIRKRFHHYRENGVSLFLLSLFCDYAYAVLVCSINDFNPPYFVSGSAASFSSAEEAVKKAFDEWEVSFVLGKSDIMFETVKPKEVILPKDHGILYRNTNCNHQINYLRCGQEISISEINVTQLKDISKLSPVYVKYKTLVDGIHVVRAFSKELIPINFGFGTDFYHHPKINKHLLNYNEFPHFFS